MAETRGRFLNPARFKFLLRGLISLALITWVVRKVDWNAIGALLTHLRFGWALSGWALTLLIILGLALRWRIFLREQGIQLPFGTIFSLTWAGQFFNSVLPGSTGGDIVKIYQVCQLAPDRKAAAAATVFVDRLAALVALLVLTGIAFVIDPVPLRILSAHMFSLKATLWWLLALLIMGAAGSWLFFRAFRSTRWGGRAIRTLLAAKDGLAVSPSLGAAVLLAFALHFLNFLICYFFSRALGLDTTYFQVLLMMPVVLFFVLLPVTINGHGLRELLLIGYFTELGITLTNHSSSGVRELVIAFSLLLVTNDLLWSIPGGIWYFTRVKTSGPSPARK